MSEKDEMVFHEKYVAVSERYSNMTRSRRTHLFVAYERGATSEVLEQICKAEIVSTKPISLSHEWDVKDVIVGPETFHDHVLHVLASFSM